MARSFNGSSDTLKNSTAILTDYPFTYACWFNVDNLTHDGSLISISDTAGNVNFMALLVEGAQSGDPLTLFVRTADVPKKASSVAPTAGTWHHAIGIGASSTDFRVYLDNADEGSNSTDIGFPAGPDVTTMGHTEVSIDANHFAGDMAEAAIWNIDIGVPARAVLAAGFAPSLVRPEALVAYWPLIGRYAPEIDRVGGANMTVSGAAAADHTRMIYPHGFQTGPLLAVVAGGANPHGPLGHPLWGPLAGPVAG